MVAPRSEPNRPPEKHSGESRPEAAPAPAAPENKNSSWQAWLPLGVALLVMPAVAYGMTTLVLIPKMQKALQSPSTLNSQPSTLPGGRPEATNGNLEVLSAGGARQSVTLNKILVNVAGTMGSRYLLTSITVLGDAADFPAQVGQREPQLRDMASGILNTKTIADLEKPGARNLIRGELLAGFNTIMGNSAVREIYFTEFAIQ